MDGANGLLHAPTILRPKRLSLVKTENGVEWAPVLAWTPRTREKSVDSAGNLTTISLCSHVDKALYHLVYIDIHP